MKKIKTELDLYDGTVIVKDIDAYYCINCKEEVFTSVQGEIVQKKLGQVVPVEAFKLRKKLIKVGNSLAMPISKEVAEFMQLHKGQEAELMVKSRHRLILNVA
ncbi:MAG: hypothetical protein J4432_04870 [DPANN group archaeon]|nr:hypothetical protein [DPANN group archaeon]